MPELPPSQRPEPAVDLGVGLASQRVVPGRDARAGAEGLDVSLAAARARHVGGEVVVDVAHVSGDAARPEGDLVVFDEGTTDAGADGDR